MEDTKEKDVCSYCGGDGFDPGWIGMTCPHCWGTGKESDAIRFDYTPVKVKSRPIRRIRLEP